MKKQFITIEIIVLLILVVGLIGCTEEITPIINNQFVGGWKSREPINDTYKYYDDLSFYNNGIDVLEVGY